MNIRKLQRDILVRKRQLAGLPPLPFDKPTEIRYTRPSGAKRVKTLNPTKGWRDMRDIGV